MRTLVGSLKDNIMRILQFFFIIILISCESNQNNLTKNKENLNEHDTNYQVFERNLSSVSIAKSTLQNTVSITLQDKNRQTLALGSGVIIDSGKVITNVHVITGAKYGYIQKENSNVKYIISGYVSIDKANDLIVLSVPDIVTSNPLIVDTIFPKVGEKIYAAGNPKGLSGTFSEGIVSSIRIIDKSRLIQISAPISPGSSGGAIVNSKGNLVGIAVGSIENGQNLNFAIPSIHINELICVENIEVKPLNISKSNYTSKADIANVKDFVKIKNIYWYYDCDNGRTPSITIPPENPLVQFSIYNNTSEPIFEIKIFIIIYDRNKLPVDYKMVNAIRFSEAILPGFAKKVENIDCDYGAYLRFKTNATIKLSKKKGYSASFRVLD